MYTSLAWAALSGLMVGADTPTLSWRDDYPAARREGAAQKKPLAVFLGAGKAGREQAVQGGLSAEARRLLAQRYVCVHVDTETERGQSLARSFEVPGGVGLVISDRTGGLQAFRHEGTLSEPDLKNYLERYSNAERVVTTTETHGSTRTSFYAPPTAPSTVAYPAFQGWSQPSYGYVPAFSGGGRAGC